EASSVVTALDGYQMARQGRAGPALAVAALGSFVAGTLATLVVAVFAPILTQAALAVGPAEYFALMVLGLICAVALAQGDRKSTRLNSSHVKISYAVFCLKKKKHNAGRSNRSRSKHSS